MLLMCYFEKENAFCRDPQEDFPSCLFFFFPNFIYFCLCWVFVVAQAFSLVSEIGGLLSIMGPGLLIEVASLIVELQLKGSQAQQLWLPALENSLNSCSVACGILPYQGLNLCLLHWQSDSLPLSYQGIPPSQS